MKITEGKLKRLAAVAGANGVIAAAAMDQRGSLKKSIAKEKGVDRNAVTPEMMSEFKTAVTRVLTPLRQRHPSGPRVRPSPPSSRRMPTPACCWPTNKPATINPSRAGFPA